MNNTDVVEILCQLDDTDIDTLKSNLDANFMAPQYGAFCTLNGKILQILLRTLLRQPLLVTV